LLVLAIDRDVAGHIAVALRRHRGALKKQGIAEPPELAEFQAAALEIANPSDPSEITRRHQASAALNVPAGTDDDLHDRPFLSRADVHRLAGVSLATVDRWLRSGRLPSVKQGHIRRIARTDLNHFLAARRELATHCNG
jgi:excisionase family DNA binding protein